MAHHRRVEAVEQAAIASWATAFAAGDTCRVVVGRASASTTTATCIALGVLAGT